MVNYRYYTDLEYPGLQWRYKTTLTSTSYRGEVRLDGGEWIPATTTLINQEISAARKELSSEG